MRDYKMLIEYPYLYIAWSPTSYGKLHHAVKDYKERCDHDGKEFHYALCYNGGAIFTTAKIPTPDEASLFTYQLTPEKGINWQREFMKKWIGDNDGN
jgi:hypothetical protein